MEHGHQMMDGVTPSQEQAAVQATKSCSQQRPSLADRHLQMEAYPSFKLGHSIGSLCTQTAVSFLMARARRTVQPEATLLAELDVKQATAATDDPLIVQEICRNAYLRVSATAADWLGQPDEASSLALPLRLPPGHQP